MPEAATQTVPTFPAWDHLALRTKAIQVKSVEKVIHSLENQRRALKEDLPDVALVAIDQAVDALGPIRRALVGELPVIVEGSALANWIRDTRGLGGGLILLLGTLPPVADFAHPSAVWKYCGLDVSSEGRAPRGERGKRLGFSPLRRAYAIMRVADPIMKSGGPYRTVYDERKHHTTRTHPPMYVDGELYNPSCSFCLQAEGRTSELRAEKKFTRERKAPSVDCSAVGGSHWTDGHRHADALRVTAKAVLRDAWRVARGMVPKFAEAGS